MLLATAWCNFSASKLQKVLPDPQFFMQFFEVRTSKSAPRPQFFSILTSHFHFHMYVSPQRRAIFRHPNLRKCSEHLSFLTFSLPNVRFATGACNFSTSELQKVFRHHQFFNIFTSKCAFRHSGLQFFDIRTSKSAPTP